MKKLWKTLGRILFDIKPYFKVKDGGVYASDVTIHLVSGQSLKTTKDL